MAASGNLNELCSLPLESHRCAVPPTFLPLSTMTQSRRPPGIGKLPATWPLYVALARGAVRVGAGADAGIDSELGVSEASALDSDFGSGAERRAGGAALARSRSPDSPSPAWSE